MSGDRSHRPIAGRHVADRRCRRQRSLQRRIGVLAAGALLAATLSVALPLQIRPVTQPGGHSTAAHASTGQLSATSDGITVPAFVVTKGQKG